jgi:hypothetical protein
MAREPDESREVDIEAAFEAGVPIDEALNRAVREAVILHRKLGLPMAVWRDNQVAWIDPDEPGDGPSTGGSDHSHRT